MCTPKHLHYLSISIPEKSHDNKFINLSKAWHYIGLNGHVFSCYQTSLLMGDRYSSQQSMFLNAFVAENMISRDSLM